MALFMVIETFKGGDPTAVGERFRAKGRLVEERSGAEFVASWMAADGSRCWQLMEAPNREALDHWIANWADLVEFDVIPVQTSEDFWRARA